MRTRTRAESQAGDRLDLSWQDDIAQPVPLGNVKEASAENPRTGEQAKDELPLFSASSGERSDASYTGTIQDAKPNDGVSPERLTSDREDGELSSSVSFAAAAASSSDESFESVKEGGDSSDSLPEFSTASPAQTQSVSLNISERANTVGGLLLSLRQRGNYSLANLEERLHIPIYFLENIEKGNYTKIFEHHQEIHYVILNIKSVCSFLRADDSTRERILELLPKELQAAGIEFSDDSIAPVSGKGFPEGSIGGVKRKKNGSILSKLPKVIIILLLVFIAVIFLLTKVAPLLGTKGKQVENKLDFAPLIVPREPPPIQLPIP